MIDVNEDSRIADRIITRNFDGGWRTGTGSANVDLVAGHVELGSSDAHRDVESNNLSTEEILPRSNAWESKGIVSAVVVEHLGTPVVWIIGGHADLCNLEPIL